MKFSGRTDIGMKRKSNQDSYAVFSKDNYFCAVVCDGMGGANGGNIASGMAVKAFSSFIRKSFAAAAKGECDTDARKILAKAVYSANSCVYNKSLTDDALDGMGTTLVAFLCCESGSFAVNVGDSRMYKLHRGNLTQVTTDHSFVQYLIDNGEISKSEAATHPNKNIILRALGVNEGVECDIFEIGSFDAVLLCTDGLTNHLSDDRILAVISAVEGKTQLKRVTDRLINEANSEGGSDNITAVLIVND